MCESDDALVEEEPAFPEAAAGEIAIELDGASLIFTPDESRSGFGPSCGPLFGAEGFRDNPDGSSVWFQVLVIDPEISNLDVEENPWVFCNADGDGLPRDSGLRIRILFTDSSGEFSELYSGDPILGGNGYFEITELELPMSFDDPDGVVSGEFEVLLHLRDTESTPGLSPLNLRGRINSVPVFYFNNTTSPYL
ncbi:hypothetical protein [Gilvibacter sp.]|uniref:hypothetical protein n=1 Tax=Gilvibacter sp. TaxID=2729997 RepID=UPI003F4A43D0